MTSTDVIHQFWVPEIRLKGALVPGLVQQLNFTPQQTGTYDIVCSEFCGKDHALMRAKLVIEPVVAFNAWLDKEKVAAAANAGKIDFTGATADAGKAVFAEKCSSCHSNPPTAFDQKVVGPGLLHITDDPAHPKLVDGDAPTRENIAKILQKGFTGPLGAMPNQQANALSNAEIASLTVYLDSLK
jgi:cytochrome c oxidase subunit 2